jgi:predicted secreted Zn-dependent protease
MLSVAACHAQALRRRRLCTVLCAAACCGIAAVATAAAAAAATVVTTVSYAVSGKSAVGLQCQQADVASSQ